MKTAQASGTPAAWESDLLWRAENDDGQPAASTFESALESLERSLRDWLRKHKKSKGACCFRGDLLGDKTQYLEVRDWSVFSPDFLQACKSWLSEGVLASYRIAIPTSPSSGQAVIIYPSVIRIWRDAEIPLLQAVTEVVQLVRSDKR